MNSCLGSLNSDVLARFTGRPVESSVTQLFQRDTLIRCMAKLMKQKLSDWKSNHGRGNKGNTLTTGYCGSLYTPFHDTSVLHKKFQFGGGVGGSV